MAAFEALALVALLAWGMALIATVLHDVVRHEPSTLTTPVPDTGMTPEGVPWVTGPPQTAPPGA